MKNNIMKSTALLATGGLVSKILGAIYRIPLSNILGAEGMGIYQLIFPLYSFALIFVSGGLPLAIARFTSQALAKKQHKYISAYFFAALFFCLLLGLLFALLFFILAKSIATLQLVQNAYFNYYIVGVSVFFAGIISCFRGLFQGYNNMLPTFWSNLIEQAFKLVLGLLLSYFLSSYNIYFGVFGAIIGLGVSEVVTLLYLLAHTIIAKKNKKIDLHFTLLKSANERKEAKQMLVYSIPITLSSLLLPLTFAAQSLVSINLLINYGHSPSLATSLFGIQTGMVNAIINFPSVISVAFATTIVPSLTYYITKKDTTNSLKLIGDIYRVIWILILPCMVGIFVLSKPIINFVFAYAINYSVRDTASLLMRISSFSILFMSITQISIVLLQTLKAQWKAFLSLFLFFVVNILLVVFYLQKFSIVALALANLIAYAFSSVLNMFFLSKKYSPNLSKKDVFIPLIISVIMGIIIFYLFNYLPINSLIIKLIICVFFAIIFYFSFLIIFKIINIKKLPIARKIQTK